MSHKVLHPNGDKLKIAGAGGYFAAPGSHPPKAGAFTPRKTATVASIQSI